MDSQARHIQARQVLRTREPYAAISNSPASVGLATLSKQSKSARQPSRVVFDARTDWEIWLIGLPPKPRGRTWSGSFGFAQHWVSITSVDGMVSVISHWRPTSAAGAA